MSERIIGGLVNAEMRDLQAKSEKNSAETPPENLTEAQQRQREYEARVFSQSGAKGARTQDSQQLNPPPVKQHPQYGQKVQYFEREYTLQGMGNVFEYRTSIKLWVQFKREFYTGSRTHGESPETHVKTGVPFYMDELKPSLAQVMFKNRFPEVDFQKAVNRAVQWINEGLFGKYTTASICFNYFDENNVERSPILQTWADGSMVFEKENFPGFLSEKVIAYQRRYEKRLQQVIAAAELVVNYAYTEVLQRSPYSQEKLF